MLGTNSAVLVGYASFRDDGDDDDDDDVWERETETETKPTPESEILPWSNGKSIL